MLARACRNTKQRSVQIRCWLSPPSCVVISFVHAPRERDRERLDFFNLRDALVLPFPKLYSAPKCYCCFPMDIRRATRAERGKAGPLPIGQLLSLWLTGPSLLPGSGFRGRKPRHQDNLVDKSLQHHTSMLLSPEAIACLGYVHRWFREVIHFEW